MSKITGNVEAVSTQYDGGLKVAGKWYNGIKGNTDGFVKNVKKNDSVELTVNDKNKIEFLQVKSPATQSKPAPAPQKKLSNDEYTEVVDNIIHDVGAIMSLCKNKTDELFSMDKNYADSMGAHCNSMFIEVSKKLKERGL